MAPHEDSQGTPAGADQAAVGAPLPSGRFGTYGALLRTRNYRLWFFSAFASGLGDWTGLVALQVLVTQLSERGSRLALFALGGIMMARMLPSLLVGPVAGVLADRYDRKRLMVVTNLLRAGLFVAIAFSTDIVALFALTFAVECFSLLFLSAKDASLPVIVRRDHLTQANQLNLLVTYGTLPVGALSATAMIGVAALLRNAGLTGVNATVLALLVNAATFLLSALLISRIGMPAHGRRATPSESPGFVEEIKEGLRFIQNLPLIRSLILGVVGVCFGAGVVISLGPALVGTSLGGRDTDWFTLMAFVGVGLVVGIVSVTAVTRRFPKEKVFPVVLAATGAIAAVMATLPNLQTTLAFGFALGAVAGLSFVIGYTLLHEYTDDEVRARTFAAFYTGTRLAMFVALAAAPFFAGVIGTGRLIVGDWNLQISGIRFIILVGGLVALYSAVRAGRGMYKALASEAARPVKLPFAGGDAGAGLFVAVEGVEGSGKSTQVRLLVERLRAEGHDVVVTREPGGSPIAERIRQVLLDPEGDAMTARTEALLYAAARAEHVEKVVLPALEAGKVVISDRFVDSSLAYQGYARGLGEDDIGEINRWAIGGILPDAVVLLYLDPDEGLRRVAERARQADADAMAEGASAPKERATRPYAPPAGGATDEERRPTGGASAVGWPSAGADRIEQEGPEFHREVARGFLELAKRDKGRFRVIDASGEPEAVAAEVRAALKRWLPPQPVAEGAGEVTLDEPEAASRK